MSVEALDVRAPLDLHQVDKNQCLSCVATNVMYMFDVSGGLSLSQVDALVGRQVGEAAKVSAVFRLLAENGLSLAALSAFDDRRVVSEGLPYLKEYYAAEWDAVWDEYWDLEHLESFQSECSQFMELVVTLGGRARFECRAPLLSDLRAFLQEGYVVLALFENRSGRVSCHAVLVYAVTETGFMVYSPQRRGPCVQEYDEEWFLEDWLPDEGITAIGRIVRGGGL